MKNLQLEQLPLFKGLTPEQIDCMRSLFTDYKDEEGAVVFKQGELADFLYVVVEGEINVRYKPEDGPELSVTKVRPGGVVGWSAVLGNKVYSSSAVCLSDCTFLRVQNSALHDLCIEKPETGRIIIERLAAVIAERLRNTHLHVISLLNQGLRIRSSGLATSD